MLETGLFTLLQSDPTVAGLAPYGGFLSQLPKDLDFSTVGGWTYSFAGGSVEHTLDGERGPRQRRLQIDAYGARTRSGEDALALSEAIDTILQSFVGGLPDTSPPSTGILSCLMEEEPTDYFDDAGRTYRRTTEYLIVFG